MLSDEDISGNANSIRPDVQAPAKKEGSNCNSGRTSSDGNSSNTNSSGTREPISADKSYYNEFLGATSIIQDGYTMNPYSMFVTGNDNCDPAAANSYEAMFYNTGEFEQGSSGSTVPPSLDSMNPLPTPQYEFDTEMLNGGYQTFSDDSMYAGYRGTPSMGGGSVPLDVIVTQPHLHPSSNGQSLSGPPLSSLVPVSTGFYSNSYQQQQQQPQTDLLSAASFSSERPAQHGDPGPISPAMPAAAPMRSRNVKTGNSAGKSSDSPNQNGTSPVRTVRKYTQRAPRPPESSAMAGLDPAVKEFRREKNKRAAREFRDRQKKLLNDLTTRVKDLEAERDGLTIRLQYMENEIRLYKEQINDYRTAMLKFTVSAAAAATPTAAATTVAAVHLSGSSQLSSSSPSSSSSSSSSSSLPCQQQQQQQFPQGVTEY